MPSFTFSISVSCPAEIKRCVSQFTWVFTTIWDNILQAIKLFPEPQEGRKSFKSAFLRLIIYFTVLLLRALLEATIFITDGWYVVFTPSIILLINSVRNKKDLKTSFLRTFGDETPLLPSPFSYISVFFFVRRLVHSCQTRWVSQDRTINFNVFPFEKKGRVSSFLASDNCNVPSCFSQTI